MTLNLSVDDVLTTTRSVRKRLDLEKPVPREVLLECLELALQAPTGSNAQGWQWVFVDDAEKKKALADIYRHQRDAVPRPAQARVRRRPRRAAAPRVRLGEIPQRASSRGAGDVDPMPGGPSRRRAAAMSRRSGDRCCLRCGVSCWPCGPAAWDRRGRRCTCSATARSRPPRSSASRSTSTARAGLFPIAYTKGTDFRPAKRLPAEQVAHWDSW